MLSCRLCHCSRAARQDVVFTDASLVRRNQRSSAGMGVWFGPHDPRNLTAVAAEQQRLHDINRYELGAIYLALLRAEPTRPLVIKTDSMAALHMLAVPERAKPQQEALVAAVLCLIKDRQQQGGTTGLCKVKAHRGCPGNEGADSLAKDAARRVRFDAVVALPTSSGQHGTFFSSALCN